MSEKEPTPDTPSSDVEAMSGYLAMVTTVLAGADAMRKAGKAYLPRLPNESEDDYEYRRQNAPFTPLYDDISRSLASKPFAQEVALEEGAAADLMAFAENVDGRGNHLHVFAQTMFKRGLDNAIHWVMVDFPDQKPGQTLADERAAQVKPYWVQIPATSIIAVYSAFVGAQEILVHVRVHEPKTIREGFGEKTVNQVRVMNREPMMDALGKVTGYGPATWELWEERNEGETKETEWVPVGDGSYSIGVIPMVPFITGERVSGWHIRAPLRNLAFMQVEEFQQESNLKSVKEQTCYPMLAGNGVNLSDGKGGKLVVPVGPRAVLTTPPSPDGRHGEWKIIEPSAESLKVLIDDLQNTRKEMRDLGMQPLTTANLTVITTANVAVRANSAVQAWAIGLKDALEQCFVLTAKWLGRNDEQVEVIVHDDFSVALEDSSALDALNKARAGKDISAPTYRAELKRRSVLSSNFNEDAEELALAEEMQGLQAEASVDPATGLPLQPQAPALAA